MSQKVRKTLIMIVMAALIICLMAASLTYTFTYGRYAGGKFDNENSPYGDLIEFVGANQYIVRTPEELIQAIEDGYSNIKIADDAEEPFVIDTGVTDVSANLVLDVNGKTLIRNSRNPMLDVQTNVSVVLIYDSSDEEQGGFYNPVGSALQASGGSLTVGSGGYESGPKDGEYFDSTQSGSIDMNSATLVTRESRTNAYGEPAEVGNLPQVGGNVYYSTETGGENTEPEGVNKDYIKDDTFLLYTIERDCFVGDGSTTVNGVTSEKGMLYTNAEQTGEGENRVLSAEQLTVACDVASCDFYYYYPIGGTTETAEVPQDYAVIYGYWDVKALAKGQYDESKEEYKSFYNSADLVWPYASVRMVEGEGFARGGQFSNNFGTVNSYGIYANGGALTASGANFTAGGDGVCIRCEGSASLSIGGGTYSSAIGNTIEMESGTMNVTAGKFTKDASSADENSTNNGSAIDIQGGTLSMIGTGKPTFTITGNYVNGVRVGDPTTSTATETATIENATFNFNKGEGSNSVAGVRSFGGTLKVRSSTFNISSVDEEDINGEGIKIEQAAGLSTEGGTVEATGCKFYFAQNVASADTTASAGISSLGGTVKAENCEFTIPGNGNYGIYSSITSGVTGENQYDTKAANCTFKLTGNNNNGIYALGGKTLASGGTYTIGSASGSGENFGIQASSGSVALAGVKLDVYGEKSSCVYAVGGTISLSGENAVNMHFSSGNATISSTAISTEGGAIEVTEGSTSVSSDALGITAREKGGNEGSISIANGAAVTVGSEKSPLPVTGVYVNGGAIENEGTITVFSTIDDRFSWNENEKYNGVYVKGGSLVSAGTLNVTFTGVQNDQKQTVNGADLTGKNAYRLFEIKSYAVRVEGDANTTVTIASGNILNGSYDENGNVKKNSGVGGGVLVNGGKVTLGNSTNNSGPTVQTTGNSTFDENPLNAGPGGNWMYELPKTGGPAIKVTQSGSVSSTLTVYGGTYTAQQGDGIVTVGGESYIYSGTFIGKDFDVASGDRAGPGASYSFKVYGGTANVYGGTFGGRENGGRYINSSGAFVMGTSADSMGTANIYGGSFVVSEVLSNNADNGGQAGFSVYEYGNVLVDPGKGGEQQNLGGDVTMTGLAAGLVIEGNTSNTVSVEIKGGEFSSTRNHGNSDGIWYSNSNATLKISGGTFTGAARSGLWFEVTPEIHDEGEIEGHGSHYSTNVKITGGGFKGDAYAIYANSEGWRPNRPSYAIGVNYIIVPGSLLRTDGWSEATAEEGIAVGYGERNPDYWNDALEDTIINCKKIAVGQYYIETWWQQN